jgi:hypothetical protein
MYQDAGAAYQLLQQQDLDGIINLANDRLEILQTFDDADPSDTMRILENAMAAKAGDPIALRDLATELTGAASAGRAMGILQAPEVRQPKGVVVNGNLVDEQTGDILYQSPAEATETFEILTPEQVQLEGLDPNRIYERNKLTNQTRVVGEGGVTTNVNLPSPVDKATERFGEGIGERASTRIDQANSAMMQNNNLMRMRESISAGAQTGLGQETLLNVKNFAQSIFGIPISETAGEQEVLRALSNRLVMEVRNPASGMGLPGATSNRDLDFLGAAVPGLAKTPQGNALLIDVIMRQNQFKQDIVMEQQRIIDQNNGAIPANLDSQLINFANNYQFVDDGLRQEIESVLALPESSTDTTTGRFIIEVVPQ